MKCLSKDTTLHVINIYFQNLPCCGSTSLICPLPSLQIIHHCLATPPNVHQGEKHRHSIIPFIKQRHGSNKEIQGQGRSSMDACVFQGIPNNFAETLCIYPVHICVYVSCTLFSTCSCHSLIKKHSILSASHQTPPRFPQVHPICHSPIDQLRSSSTTPQLHMGASASRASVALAHA